MQDFVYLKNAGEHRVEVPLEPLNVLGLATVLKLRPLGLCIGMTILNPDANGQCASFPDVVQRLRQEDASIGTTEDKAILVEGDPAAAAPSAAGGSQQWLVARLQRLAELGDIRHVEERVVKVLVHIYAAQLQYADDKDLAQLYQLAAAAPLTSTKHNFQENHGLKFNGRFMEGPSPGRSLLMVAFQDDKCPKLVKLAHDGEAIKREYKVLEELWKEPSVPNIVGPVSAVTSFSKKTFVAYPSLSGQGTDSLHPKMGLVMPVYPSTLAHISTPVAANALLEFGSQLKTALQGMHEKGYCHNDVKATNVFITAEGTCVLGDFGAATKIGRAPIETTPSHWPGHAICSEGTDFYLLAVTLLERAEAYTLKCDTPPTPVELKAALEQVENMDLKALIRDWVDML